MKLNDAKDSCNITEGSITETIERLSTEALHKIIIEMHAEGHPDEAIAARFGYQRSYIQSQRNKIGLKANHGKKAPRFTEEMDDDILIYVDESRLPYAEIGRILDRPWAEVKERYYYLDQKRMELAEKGPVVLYTKKCICKAVGCLGTFQTLDKKKEWYCEPCRVIANKYGNYAESTYDISGGTKT